MPTVARRSRGEEYARWQAGYRAPASEAARQAAGWRDQQVFRNPDAPNEVVILSEVDDLERARASARSEEVRTRQRASGLLAVTHVSPEPCAGAPGRPRWVTRRAPVCVPPSVPTRKEGASWRRTPRPPQRPPRNRVR